MIRLDWHEFIETHVHSLHMLLLRIASMQDLKDWMQFPIIIETA